MKAYWETKDGRVMNVDDMSDAHVRNVFKILLRDLEKMKAQAKLDAETKRKSNRQFVLKGDMANDFNDSMEFNDLCDACELDLY